VNLNSCLLFFNERILMVGAEDFDFDGWMIFRRHLQKTSSPTQIYNTHSLWRSACHGRKAHAGSSRDVLWYAQAFTSEKSELIECADKEKKKYFKVQPGT